MATENGSVNQSSFAPLRNVTLFLELVERQIARPAGMERLGVFFGPSGYGKTKSAVYASNKYHAYYVECGSSWTPKTLADNILHELGAPVQRGNVAEKVQEIIGLLYDDTRPLIIDEADHLVKKSIIDIVREIHDKTVTPVILIGEEQLPRKLGEFERAHNRVNSFVAAEPADEDDARALVKVYCPKLAVSDDVIAEIVYETRGTTRRIVNNLHALNEFAAQTGQFEIGHEVFQEFPVFTGNPEPRRVRPPRGRAAASARGTAA